MPGMIDDFMREQLMDRRERLRQVLAEPARIATSRVRDLLEEVDTALARMDEGSWGICELCHQAVEQDRLMADPLVRFCLDHLNEPEKRALERDLELAAQVQRSLLPRPHVEWSGWHVSYHYEPAGIVSGDYCDVVDGRDAGLYFMVGDVSGKGVAASMLMAHLHAMFRTLIAVGLPLRAMMQHASRVFSESTLPTHYATLVCGRADAAGRVEVCNAGHPPPLVIGNGVVRDIEASGLPVGLFTDEEFAVSELCLQNGEAMLVYSDGVSEAVDHAGTEYGIDRLRSLTAGKVFSNSSALIALCRDDLAGFCGDVQRMDDITLFALCRGG